MSTQNNDSTVRLVFHSDASHGWAQVPHSLIWELHLQTLISNYSYVDETYSYLEEDSDLALLDQALKERGLVLSFSEKRVKGASPIRAKHRYTESFMPAPEAYVDLTVCVEFEVLDASEIQRVSGDSFNWTVSATNCRLELAERVSAEVERQTQFGWLRDKTLRRVSINSVTRNMPDGRFLEFPVVSLH